MSRGMGKVQLATVQALALAWSGADGGWATKGMVVIIAEEEGVFGDFGSLVQEAASDRSHHESVSRALRGLLAGGAVDRRTAMTNGRHVAEYRLSAAVVDRLGLGTQ